ncbi:MAG: cryptochrome/photolyase family protein [Parasphingorhabdus sp.]|nr:cryptochrome/photolyase family protein [Parasphingorhabdus sp.]
MAVRNLILILGDQLSLALSSLSEADPARDRILMAEVQEEASYVRHHKKKIAFLFAAMRHFAAELRDAGWTVDYVKLDDPDNRGSFAGEIAAATDRLTPAQIIATEPGEYRVRQALLAAGVTLLPDTRFIASTQEFADWAEGRKQLRMEYFYRDMRRKTGLLMDGDQPAGGKWNYDAENRKPADADLFMPQPPKFDADASTREVLELVAARFADHFGDLEPFTYAVTRAGAEEAFAHFLKTGLPRFGDFQDAMLTGEPYLYHSVISQYLNCGLLDPLQMCRAVEKEFRKGRAPLNAAEGYIRQIIGWREYMRGIYWLKMPEYAASNFFDTHRPLPEFYWTGNTDMACLRAAIDQTREHAYAHHIQRLMVTGNFAMLAGINPDQVHRWYLAVYHDAYEWVEMPNTIGMSQFADGGVVASKPLCTARRPLYQATYVRITYGGYRYDVKLTHQSNDACPYNALYWDFLARNRAKLERNPRIGQMLRTYDKFAPAEQQRITASAAKFLDSLSP